MFASIMVGEGRTLCDWLAHQPANQLAAQLASVRNGKSSVTLNKCFHLSVHPGVTAEPQFDCH